MPDSDIFLAMERLVALLKQFKIYSVFAIMINSAKILGWIYSLYPRCKCSSFNSNSIFCSNEICPKDGLHCMHMTHKLDNSKPWQPSSLLTCPWASHQLPLQLQRRCSGADPRPLTSLRRVAHTKRDSPCGINKVSHYHLNAVDCIFVSLHFILLKLFCSNTWHDLPVSCIHRERVCTPNVTW